jgi:phosphonate transport system substrate-binding protein
VLCIIESSSIEKISDIKGKSIAFGLEESTERYIAQKYLFEHRIRSSDLRSYAYIDGYNSIINGLLAGTFDIAVLHERTFEELVVKGAPIRMLARFEITSFPWIARSDLESSILKYLQKTLLNSDGIEIFDAFRKDGFLSGEDDDFDQIRKAVEENHRFFQ